MLIPASVLYLWALLQLAILLLLQQAFSPWIMAIFVLLTGYKLYSLRFTKRVVSLKLVNVLAALIALVLVINIRQAGVMHFMLQILLLAASCRLLALKYDYDARQLTWVHYFLIGCCFVMHQQILMALLIFGLIALNLYCHYRLYAPRGAGISWRQSGRSILLILPLWLGMFVLFPRLPPFWQIPNAKVASTGLSDSLDPGSIEKLVRDESLAFRVEFNTAVPKQADLYWRSYLYEDFDGRSWTVNPLRRPEKKPAQRALAAVTQSMSYRVIAEISHQRNLFALGEPLAVEGNGYLTTSGLVAAPRPVNQRTSYQISGMLNPIAQASAYESTINLRRVNANPKTREFARKLGSRYSEAPQLVQAIWQHFNQQSYFYSLTPPALGDDSIDAFLFDTQTGFCSHYASATAVILREAGIAARVVGGYQGGVWHEAQGYLAVRQREAHAWVEYLHQGNWYTFDPTAAVAPERILENLESALDYEQQALLSSYLQWPLIDTLYQQFMHLDYYWSVWVLGFNDNNQQYLWQRLRQHLGLISAILATLGLLVIVALLYSNRQQRKAAPLPASTALLQRYGARLMHYKPTQQSVSAFLLALAQRSPQHQAWLQHVVQLHERAVYQDDATALPELKQQLKRGKAQLAALLRCVENT